jgi:hypothetical protein
VNGEGRFIRTSAKVGHKGLSEQWTSDTRTLAAGRIPQPALVSSGSKSESSPRPPVVSCKSVIVDATRRREADDGALVHSRFGNRKMSMVAPDLAPATLDLAPATLDPSPATPKEGTKTAMLLLLVLGPVQTYFVLKARE